ncbi:MAG: helix-turn-helix domain-containing protein [Nevskia sp.]|nr:helix-turn-helix domain-containing protein [Nevskia sp.]
MVTKKASATRPPHPGARVRGSTSGRPVMALLDLLGRRWTLRVVWELRDGPLVFRELQSRCGISPSVLNTRLAELRQARLLQAGEDGYALTAEGRELFELFSPISRWAERWAGSLRDAERKR